MVEIERITVSTPMNITVLWVLVGLIVIVAAWLIAVFNGLIRLKNRVQEAWADIDVQLKRRYDLIPNLVETVKGYASHERELLERVTQARTAAMGATSTAQKAQAENMLSQSLKSLFAVAENYPQLRAVESFTKLQDELSDTENKIQASRRFYNGQVRDFNTKIQVFPNNLIAANLGFKPYEFFELEEAAAKQPVKVSF